MAHNIAMIDGQAAMAYYGETPWHGLGTALPRAATAAEIIAAAGLDWTVEKRPIAGTKTDENGNPLYWEIVRKAAQSDGVDVQLGRCTSAYQPLQNREAFAFFDLIVANDSAIYHTAGALGDGEKVWVLAKLPSSIVVKGGDEVEKFLLLSNSHNGREAVTVKFTPIRVVCQNTLNAAMQDGNAGIRLKHTASLQARLAEVPDLLGISYDVFSGLEELYSAMADKTLTTQGVHDYLNMLMPLTDTQSVKKLTDGLLPTRWQAVLADFERHEIPATNGTLWAAYNAFTHYIDYVVGREQGNPDARLKRTMFGAGADAKVQALQAARKVLTAA